MNGKIYHVFDTTNGKSYIGQTTQSLSKRRCNHFGTKGSLPFVNALRKRPDAFIWSLLATGITTQGELDDAELYWGHHFNCLVPSGYNLKLGQGRGICSDEFKNKLSIILKEVHNRPDVRKNHSDATKVQMQNPERREKCRNGRLGKKASEHTRLLLKAARALRPPDSLETRERKRQAAARRRSIT